ncbi:hypothetical protein [Spiroplasma cantharicola]|uniref:Uncharacterized protein n=1 Tax=Spiroplasma cantharicola TaxID=362837 RepID=A0A0M5KCD6_9MOLU|nr:hypothetical protein [Spiroplasma cantharicola]ALD66393.1 hypothetical protein SCANT_v1c04870 [Spiroplasma cantharicola]
MNIIWIISDLILIILLTVYYVFFWPNRWRWNRDVSRIINKKRKVSKIKFDLNEHLTNKTVRTNIFKTFDDQNYFCDIKYQKGNSRVKVQELEITVLKYPEELFEQDKEDFITKCSGKAIIKVKNDSQYYNNCEIELKLIDKKYKLKNKL